jgi:asparaginyl-tRNA synthetase
MILSSFSFSSSSYSQLPLLSYSSFDCSDDMELAERFVKFCINELLNQCEEDLNFCNTSFDNTLLTRLRTMINTDFVRLEYTEAIKILKNNHFVSSMNSKGHLFQFLFSI